MSAANIQDVARKKYGEAYGKSMSGFVRAVKPAPARCCGPSCRSAS